MPEQIRVLLIEDELPVAAAIRDGLDATIFSLNHGSTLAEGRRLLAHAGYDVVVLDLTLPDGSGLDLADELRQRDSQVPILMLTAQSSVDARVDGFRHGADDYLCKPFSVTELAARLSALLRRSRNEPRHVLRYGGVELDLLTRHMRRGELEASLSTRELELLAFLMHHPEKLLTQESILTHIWGSGGPDEINILYVYANSLRNKLEGGLYPRLIHTVRGVGLILSTTEPGDDLPVGPGSLPDHPA